MDITLQSSALNKRECFECKRNLISFNMVFLLSLFPRRPSGSEGGYIVLRHPSAGDSAE